MRKLKVFVSGLVIGTLIGLWGGVNIGKQQPLHANPFSGDAVSETLRDAGRSAVRESADVLEKSGQQLRESTEDQSGK